MRYPPGNIKQLDGVGKVKIKIKIRESILDGYNYYFCILLWIVQFFF